MARKSRQNQEDRSPGFLSYARHAVPIVYDVFSAWRDRRKWDEVLADLELLAARSEKQARAIRVLTAAVLVLSLWTAGLTVFVLTRLH